MKFSYDTQIRFSDVDCTNKVSLGKIVDFLQNCSALQSEVLDIGVDYQMKTRKAWIINSWQINILEPLRYTENIKVSTWATSFKRGIGKRNYTIYNEDGSKNMVEADSTWVSIDMDKKIMVAPDPKEVEVYGYEEKLPMESFGRKIRDMEGLEYKEDFKVHNFQLDINGHMNNAWYVKIAEEFLKESADKVKVLRVEYKNSAVYGDIIKAYIAEDEERQLVELKSENEEIFAKIEFRF